MTALKQCPVGRWVQVDDFFRFMIAAALRFEVTREPWDLYISDPQYGSLGYEGYHDWEILQGRYTLCLLFEYAATLGMIDVAYVNPAGVRRDYREMWGTDDLEFLSRYDGLIAFRLNALGAYGLGLARTYEPEQIEARAQLTVLPSLQINVRGGRSLLTKLCCLRPMPRRKRTRCGGSTATRPSPRLRVAIISRNSAPSCRRVMRNHFPKWSKASSLPPNGGRGRCTTQAPPC